MNRFDAPDSIFAPIVAAVPPGTQWAGFVNSTFAAQTAVPTAAVRYSVKQPGKFKRESQIRERRLVSLSGDSGKPFSVKVRCYDRPRGQSGPIELSETLWEVGIVNLKDGLCLPAVPEDYDSAILQTSILKYSAIGVTGAPQLALFRHLWAYAVLAAAPQAIVFGGQHQWQNAWWTEKVAESVEA